MNRRVVERAIGKVYFDSTLSGSFLRFNQVPAVTPIRNSKMRTKGNLCNISICVEFMSRLDSNRVTTAWEAIKKIQNNRPTTRALFFSNHE